MVAQGGRGAPSHQGSHKSPTSLDVSAGGNLVLPGVLRAFGSVQMSTCPCHADLAYLQWVGSTEVALLGLDARIRLILLPFHANNAADPACPAMTL